MINVTSDAAVEAYEGWGGYGSAKAALEQVTRVLAAEHPELRIVAVDPGDMNTQLHQEAFPGEDISDRPPPEASVPGPAGDRLRRRPERALPGQRGGPGMSALAFEVPPVQPARERDHVRMLVASRAGISHHRFLDLPDLLEPGDLLVVNTSATLPAALDGSGPRVHLSTPLPAAGAPLARRRARALGDRAARGRRPPSRRPRRAADRAARAAARPSCWRRTSAAGGCGRRGCGSRRRCSTTSTEHGEPIRYRHQPEPRPLADYQTIFASEPGSAEMPSAGRPFSERVLERLEERGITVATIVLHAGVSSLERGERPYPERFRVPDGTLAAVRAAKPRDRGRHHRGARAGDGGRRRHRGLDAARGRARARGCRGVRVVDGILTGWHEPDASHLLMLEAIAGRRLVERSYEAALADGYRWHEFGDSHLLLAG